MDIISILLLHRNWAVELALEQKADRHLADGGLAERTLV